MGRSCHEYRKPAGWFGGLLAWVIMYYTMKWSWSLWSLYYLFLKLFLSFEMYTSKCFHKFGFYIVLVESLNLYLSFWMSAEQEEQNKGNKWVLALYARALFVLKVLFDSFEWFLCCHVLRLTQVNWIILVGIVICHTLLVPLGCSCCSSSSTSFAAFR